MKTQSLAWIGGSRHRSRCLLSQGIMALGAAMVCFSLSANTMAQSTRTVTAADPIQLANLLRREGFQATIGVDSQGDPMIRSAAEGVNFSMFFYGCNNNINCGAVQFSSGFSMNRQLSTELMNEWNSRKAIGKAYLSGDGHPRIGHYIMMRGGMTESNFIEAFRTWRIALRDYVEHIGYR